VEDAWVKKGEVHMPTARLANRLGMHATEVGSCIRVLSDGGCLEKKGYEDRPVEVWVWPANLEQLRRKLGKRQDAVFTELCSHADHEGAVRGTVRFFLNIGADKKMLESLRNRNLVMFEWVENCQVLRVLDESLDGLDFERMERVMQRSIERIDAAAGYLYTPGCRREYLVSYFYGVAPGALDVDIDQGHNDCCDRCRAKIRRRG